MSSKVKIIKFTLNQLIQTNVHLGSHKQVLNSQIKPYILGNRNLVSILNLNYSYLQFKVFIQLIINLVSYRQKIFLINEVDLYDFNPLFKNEKRLIFYNFKWLGGYLTNAKKLKFNTKYTTVPKLKYMPGLIITLNSNISQIAITEAFNLEIPLAGFIDSKSENINLINYKLIGNNISLESLYFYCFLIKQSIKLGKQKEIQKVLYLL